MDYFERLVTTLPNLLSNSSPNAEFLLQQTLEDARPRLLNLLNLNPRNPSEKAEVESGTRYYTTFAKSLLITSLGKITLSGKPTLFNNDFKLETLLLAEELDCSERYCAQLLEHVVRHGSNIAGSRISERALILHHTERASLLSCLRIILESASNQELEPRLVALLQRYTIDIIGHQYDLSDKKEKGPLAIKILHEIDALKHAIAKQRAKLQTANAPPPTYSWQQSGKTHMHSRLYGRIILIYLPQLYHRPRHSVRMRYLHVYRGFKGSANNLAISCIFLALEKN